MTTKRENFPVDSIHSCKHTTYTYKNNTVMATKNFQLLSQSTKNVHCHDDLEESEDDPLSLLRREKY
jgi:hypothetical protein